MPAISSSWSVSHRGTPSRLSCGSLRSALTWPRRDAKNLFYWEEEMAGFVSGRLSLRCRLPLVGIGRSAEGDEFYT
jgi:hypothetical protein